MDAGSSVLVPAGYWMESLSDFLVWGSPQCFAMWNSPEGSLQHSNQLSLSKEGVEKEYEKDGYHCLIV